MIIYFNILLVLLAQSQNSRQTCNRNDIYVYACVFDIDIISYLAHFVAQHFACRSTKTLIFFTRVIKS